MSANRNIETTAKAMPRGRSSGRQAVVVIANRMRQVIQAGRFRSARAGRADPTPPKLVILDLHMPILPGMEVLRQIRADPGTMDIAVVVLTGGYHAEEIRQAQNLGVTSYFLKPSDRVRGHAAGDPPKWL